MPLNRRCVFLRLLNTTSRFPSHMPSYTLSFSWIKQKIVLRLEIEAGHSVPERPKWDQNVSKLLHISVTCPHAESNYNIIRLLIFGSWTQPGAWNTIVPFWYWDLSETAHVRSHTKFQLIWAIKLILHLSGGGWFKCGAGTPSGLSTSMHFARVVKSHHKFMLASYMKQIA